MATEDNVQGSICSTDERHQQMLETDILYKNAQTMLASINASLTSGALLIAEHIRIPVVFHILHHTNAQEISTEQIDSQIDALNRDFNLLNTDIDTVPSVWKGVVGNPKFTFFRTRRGPTGEKTEGIVKKYTYNKIFPDGSNAMKFDTTGGSNIWDRDRFLNIWVCDIGEVLGFAQFPAPGAARETDGVVINYRYFGQIGTAKYPYNLGRTAVHEVGHWLNLRHIWGGDRTDPQYKKDDGVLDTPFCDGYNEGKPLFPKVSHKAKNGPNGDMFINYVSIPRTWTCLNRTFPFGLSRHRLNFDYAQPHLICFLIQVHETNIS